MSLIDTSTNSPHYFYWKHIRTTNENNNFNIRVKRVKSTSDQPSLFTLGVLHTYPDIFESATFSAFYPVNPAYEFANFWIRSPEWKFLNKLWIRNRVDGYSGYFFFIQWRNKIEAGFLPWIFKMVPSAMFSLLSFLNFSVKSYNLCAVKLSYYHCILQFCHAVARTFSGFFRCRMDELDANKELEGAN